MKQEESILLRVYTFNAMDFVIKALIQTNGRLYYHKEIYILSKWAWLNKIRSKRAERRLLKHVLKYDAFDKFVTIEEN